MIVPLSNRKYLNTRGKNSPLLQLLVVRSLLNQIKDLPISLPLPEHNLDRHTWLVSWALARGKALGLGVAILDFLEVYAIRWRLSLLVYGLTGGIPGLLE